MNETGRIGIGYDLHRLAEGRRLILGGVEVPFERGLTGHSDADVVLHAVADALLGAAGLPDLGDLFPDTDPAYRGADSAALVTEVLHRVRAAGFGVHNVDVIIHAQAPRLTGLKRRIADSVAALLEAPAGCVSVKAKTGEGLDAVGEGRAIACTAVVSLAPRR